MATKVFVSPGVYTSEKDLSFITRQVGVTTLGLVGETTIGPAFQPIFISNYGEFQSFFGGTNATKVKDTGAPKYELPYIAKSYLSQSNQLFVTRVLGLSGYDAGKSWGVKLMGNVDVSTRLNGATADFIGTTFISYSLTSGGTFTMTSTTPALTTRIANGDFDNLRSFLINEPINNSVTGATKYTRNGVIYDGFGYTATMVSRAAVDATGTTKGVATGSTITSTASPFADVEGKLVAMLRSRGSIDNNTQTPNFQVGGVVTITGTTGDALGQFTISGNSNTQGNFTSVISLDKTKKNYLPRVLGRDVQDGNTPLFVEEFYGKMFNKLNKDNKIYGVSSSMVDYGQAFANYKQEYQPAITPYVVSELRGNNILKLFRFHTISDGNAANEQFKISIRNIKMDTREFDVVIRAYYDTDAQPTILESFSRCTMDQTSNNYIGRRIGTLDGLHPSKSAFVLIEMDDTADTSDAFPAGFTGYPIRNYQVSGATATNPKLTYNTEYDQFDNKRKIYLGLSETVGIDSDFFDYKGVDNFGGNRMTNGFHMDSGATINNSGYIFDTGSAEFRTDNGVIGSDYEKIYARKFTFAPFGGYDGWDVYRTRRSNEDRFIVNGTAGSTGLITGAFSNRNLSNGDMGSTSDYYAYLEAIWTFKNPEAVNINVFATPGIDNRDNTNLIEAAIDMIETDRADSLYIMTTPDTDSAGDVISVEDVAGRLDGMFDSNYSCTYWPWVQIQDAENNVNIFIPPTRDVVRNIALTDNISFPWFAVAGIQRGDVNAVQARKKLTLAERDELYENRINPIATFTSDGIKIWGNKTLQVKESALNRINVRRLLLQARKLISAVSIRLLFEQNDSVVRNQFLALVNPILDNIRSERGLTDFRVVLSNDPEDIDRNQLTGQIFLKPTRALEFIQLEFVIMNTGASFDNI